MLALERCNLKRAVLQTMTDQSERLLYRNLFRNYMVKPNIELMMRRNAELKNIKIGP